MDDILPLTNNSFNQNSESLAVTEIKSIKHIHTWIIKGFSQCECRYLESIPLLPHLDNGKHVFRVRLHPQGNKESNKDFCFFQVFSQSNYKYKAKFTVVNVSGEEIPATVYNGTQQLNGYFEYIRREQLIQHIQPQDEVKLILKLSVVYETVTKTMGPNVSKLDDCSLCAFSRDISDSFTCDNNFTDFIISCNDATEKKREINCHRFMLYSRSKVFRAMLQEHTGEYKAGKVHFPDIDYDVMMELIKYIYSGRMTTRDQQMLQELLKVGERFEVDELKCAAETALKSLIRVDNVCSLLSLADIHNSSNLRKACLRFISLNMGDALKTEGWQEFVASYPELATECMVSVVNNGEESSSEDPPEKKRFRIELQHQD